MKRKQTTIRLSKEEDKILAEYCAMTQRTQNDVLRELVRGLPRRRAVIPVKKVKPGDVVDVSFEWAELAVKEKE